MNLFSIKCTIEDKYKDGNDWVYAKGKKAEIDIIRSLLEICEIQQDEITDLTKQVRVVDKWEAYSKAECYLERVYLHYDELHNGLIEYKKVQDLMLDAREKLAESRSYLDEIFERIKEKNT
jgi:hypothetical protein